MTYGELHERLKQGQHEMALNELLNFTFSLHETSFLTPSVAGSTTEILEKLQTYIKDPQGREFLNSIVKEEVAALRKEKDTLQKRHDALVGEIEVGKGQVDELQAVLHKSQSQGEILAKEFERQEDVMKVLEKDNRTLTEKLQRAFESLRKKDGELTACRTDIRAREAQYQRDVQIVQSKNREVQADARESEEINQQLKEEVRKLQDRISELREISETSEERAIAAEERVFLLKATFERKEKNLEHAVDMKGGAIQEMEASLSQMRGRMEEVQNHLEEQLDEWRKKCGDKADQLAETERKLNELTNLHELRIQKALQHNADRETEQMKRLQEVQKDCDERHAQYRNVLSELGALQVQRETDLRRFKEEVADKDNKLITETESLRREVERVKADFEDGKERNRALKEEMQSREAQAAEQMTERRAEFTAHLERVKSEFEARVKTVEEGCDHRVAMADRERRAAEDARTRQLEERNQDAARNREVISKMQADGEKLRQKHVQQMTDLRGEQEKRLAELKEQNQDFVRSLERIKNERLEELKGEYEKKLESISSDHGMNELLTGKFHENLTVQLLDAHMATKAAMQAEHLSRVKLEETEMRLADLDMEYAQKLELDKEEAATAVRRAERSAELERQERANLEGVLNSERQHWASMNERRDNQMERERASRNQRTEDLEEGYNQHIERMRKEQQERIDRLKIENESRVRSMQQEISRLVNEIQALNSTLQTTKTELHTVRSEKEREVHSKELEHLQEIQTMTREFKRRETDLKRIADELRMQGETSNRERDGLEQQVLSEKKWVDWRNERFEAECGERMMAKEEECESRVKHLAKELETQQQLWKSERSRLEEENRSWRFKWQQAVEAAERDQRMMRTEFDREREDRESIVRSEHEENQLLLNQIRREHAEELSRNRKECEAELKRLLVDQENISHERSSLAVEVHTLQREREILIRRQSDQERDFSNNHARDLAQLRSDLTRASEEKDLNHNQAMEKLRMEMEKRLHNLEKDSQDSLDRQHRVHQEQLDRLKESHSQQLKELRGLYDTDYDTKNELSTQLQMKEDSNSELRQQLHILKSETEKRVSDAELRGESDLSRLRMELAEREHQRDLLKTLLETEKREKNIAVSDYEERLLALKTQAALAIDNLREEHSLRLTELTTRLERHLGNVVSEGMGNMSKMQHLLQDAQKIKADAESGEGGPEQSEKFRQWESTLLQFQRNQDGALQNLQRDQSQINGDLHRLLQEVENLRIPQLMAIDLNHPTRYPVLDRTRFEDNIDMGIVAEPPPEPVVRAKIRVVAPTPYNEASTSLTRKQLAPQGGPKTTTTSIPPAPGAGSPIGGPGGFKSKPPGIEYSATINRPQAQAGPTSTAPPTAFTTPAQRGGRRLPGTGHGGESPFKTPPPAPSGPDLGSLAGSSAPKQQPTALQSYFEKKSSTSSSRSDGSMDSDFYETPRTQLHQQQQQQQQSMLHAVFVKSERKGGIAVAGPGRRRDGPSSVERAAEAAAAAVSGHISGHSGGAQGR